MAGLSNTILREVITLDSSSRLQHFQDDQLPDLDHRDHPDKIRDVLKHSSIRPDQVDICKDELVKISARPSDVYAVL